MLPGRAHDKVSRGVTGQILAFYSSPSVMLIVGSASTKLTGNVDTQDVTGIYYPFIYIYIHHLYMLYTAHTLCNVTPRVKEGV